MANPGQPMGSPYGYTAENLGRYNEIVAGYKHRLSNFGQETTGINAGWNNVLAGYAGVGDSSRIALGQQFAKSAADAKSYAIQHGLGGSTVAMNMTRGVNADYFNSLASLNDQQAMGRANLQMGQLNYLAGAQQGAAGLAGDTLGFQGQAFGQKYGAEAGYGFQSLLGQQNYGYNSALANQSAGNSASLAQQQYMQQLQQMQQQQRFQDQMQSTYGYY